MSAKKMSENEVNVTNFEYICRVCCVNELCNLKSIFDERVESKPLKDILMACAHIEIKPNDGLPQQICDDCLNQVILSYDFREKCEKNDTYLRNVLKQSANCDDNIVQNDLEVFDALPVDVFLDEDDNSVEILANENDCLIISDDDYDATETDNTAISDPKLSEDCMEIDTNFSCPICGIFCTNPGGLASHMKVHPISNQVIMKTSSLLIEIYKAELTEPYQKYVALCKICDAWFTRIKQLRNHIAKHTDISTLNFGKLKNKLFLFDLTKISPTECGLVELADSIANDIRNNDLHRFYQIRDPTGYELELSDSDSENESGETLRHYCFKCEEIFNRAYKLHKHIRQKHRRICELPFKCPSCNRKYATEFLLQRHQKRQCFNSHKQYNCEMCRIKFMWQNSYNIHNYVCHGVNKKDFQCEICKKTFTQKRHMDRHVRTHNPDERKYECPVCLKKFHRSDYLRYHMKKHHGACSEEIDKIIWDVSRRGNYCRKLAKY